jgi:hypothetical protein
MKVRIRSYTTPTRRYWMARCTSVLCREKGTVYDLVIRDGNGATRHASHSSALAATWRHLTDRHLPSAH